MAAASFLGRMRTMRPSTTLSRGPVGLVVELDARERSGTRAESRATNLRPTALRSQVRVEPNDRQVGFGRAERRPTWPSSPSRRRVGCAEVGHLAVCQCSLGIPRRRHGRAGSPIGILRNDQQLRRCVSEGLRHLVPREAERLKRDVAERARRRAFVLRSLGVRSRFAQSVRGRRGREHGLGRSRSRFARSVPGTTWRSPAVAACCVRGLPKMAIDWLRP
jgi:hypothetical protein